jgi:hypothetical protein
MVDASQPILSCKDSPLSITANLIGILTFVAAIYLAYGAFYTERRALSDDYRSYLLELKHRTSVSESISRKLSLFDIGDSEQLQLLGAVLVESRKSQIEAASLLDRLISQPGDSHLGRLAGATKSYMARNYLRQQIADMREQDSKLCLCLLEYLFQ